MDLWREQHLNDGKLSMDEFQAFFSDGTLNEEELEKLFHTIDSDNTSNVDTKELCDYFAKHMGDYEGVLASLETLNLSILKAMDFTKKPRPGRQPVVQQLQSKGKTSAITAPLWRCRWITFQSAVFSVIVVIHTVSS
ncbi:unnamed protein product [Boreogadus saida]